MSIDHYQAALASEFEVAFIEPESRHDDYAKRHDWTQLNADQEPGTPSNTLEVAREARNVYANLRPTNDKEAETRRAWLEYVDNGLSRQDIVNYRIYSELSEPQLTYATYPIGASYAEITNSSVPLEFRGPGQLQQGWYDLEDISEMRMTPVPSEKFSQHKTRILRTAARIATEEGLRAYLGSEHINASPYIDGESVLKHDLAPYLAVAAGLRHIYREGGLINPDIFPKVRQHIFWMSSQRQNVRFMPGRIEFRGREVFDGPSYDNARRFLIAGMRYGVEHSTEDEQAQIKTITALKATPLEGYDKTKDLYVKRWIESCAIPSVQRQDRNYRFSMMQRETGKALSSLVGRELTGEYFQEMIYLFMSGIELNAEGYLQTSPQLMDRVLQMDPALQIGASDIPAINACLRKFKVTLKEEVYHGLTAFAPQEMLDAFRQATTFPRIAPEEYNEITNALNTRNI